MSNIKNILKKKLATIPKDWGVAELGKIGQSIIGLTYSPNDIVDHSGTLVLRSSNIVGNHIDYSDGVYVNKAIPEKLIVKEGDILVCARNGSRGLIGKNAYIDKISAGNSFGAFMSVYRTSSSPFVFQFFQSEPFRKQIYRNLGATINQITTKNLNEFIIPFPPLPEQKKIAEILGKWDDGIETVEKLIAAKKKLKKALMQQLLTGKKRFKEFEGQEWEHVNLENLCKIKTGKKDVNEGNSTGEYPFFTCAKEITYSDTFSFDTKAILIAGNGEVGHCRYYEGKFEVYQRTYVLHKFCRCDIAFLFQYLRLFLERKVQREKQQGAMPYMKLGLLTHFKINLPPQKEQQKIASVLNAADKEIELLNNKLQALKNQKKGLMQKLLTGQIRVKV